MKKSVVQNRKRIWETVGGYVERTDEMEVPGSSAENSLFAACIWVGFSAIIKAKPRYDNDVKGGCNELQRLVFSVLPVGSSLKCLGRSRRKMNKLSSCWDTPSGRQPYDASWQWCSRIWNTQDGRVTSLSVCLRGGIVNWLTSHMGRYFGTF